jgi:NTP pyrophosphatase (non-canonical NTP hydrolase)
MQIDLNKYQEFVGAVTSAPSNSSYSFQERWKELEAGRSDVNLALLVTACMGLAAESGEFNEIPKKILFQGKPLTDENIHHMKRELGDIMWYWVNACRALQLDPNDVILENINKLKSRYPGGEFDAHYSENRQAGDL